MNGSTYPTAFARAAAALATVPPSRPPQPQLALPFSPYLQSVVRHGPEHPAGAHSALTAARAVGVKVR